MPNLGPFLMSAEVLLHLLEAAEDPHVEEEERDEGDDARGDGPRPVDVGDDVGLVEAELSRLELHSVNGSAVLVVHRAGRNMQNISFSDLEAGIILRCAEAP